MTDTDMRNAVARLPKWARDRIANLERQLAEKTRQIALLSEGPADSDVLVRDYVYPDRPLGKGIQIVFTMGEAAPRGRPAEIIVAHSRERPGMLEVRAISDYGQAVTVIPVASNQIRLAVGPY